MRLLAITGLLLAGLGLCAQPPAETLPPQPAQSPQGTASSTDPVLEQSLIAARYRQLEDLLLRIAQRMERSGNPETSKKARVIQRALKEARDKAIAVNLTQLAESLKKPGLAELKKAVEQGGALRGDLEQLLLALLADDENNQDKIKQLQELIKQLDAAIRAQKIANAKNQNPSVDKEDAAKAQDIAKLQTEAILAKLKQQQGEKKPAGKESDQEGKGKEQEGKEGEPKDGKGKEKDSGNKGSPKDQKSPEKKDPAEQQPKPGKDQGGDPKDSDAKGKPKPSDQQPKPSQQGQPSDGQEGEPKDGQPSPPPGEQPDEQQQSRQRIKDANDHQKKASDKIKEDKRTDASPEQDEATRKLEEARKRLEEILKQMREEEVERVLADLQKRCEAMLQMQEIVYDNTKRLFGKIQSLPGHKALREEELASRRLGDEEDKIGLEADKAIAIIEAEGSAVAFLETFRQVRGDVTHVSRRLSRVNPGPETQLIEEDIIATLKDMIEALKKQQKEQRDKKDQQQQQNGEPPPQSLIDKLAELRMIKALQLRVYHRTKAWGQRYAGEQAQDPEILSELRDLSQRQLKIHQITDNLAKGKNQ